ncbi:MAG: BRcat domain-containing protein [Lachnospiraceae bacterium]|jgi:hypothetical protein
MKNWFQNFMSGRYGSDEFNRFLNVVTIILLILSFFFWGGILATIAVVLLIYSYYRMFSKNLQARRDENAWYLDKKYKVQAFFRSGKGSGVGEWFRQVGKNIKSGYQTVKLTFKYGKEYHIYTCPNPDCRTKIRVPKGKGRIEITCPKCHEKFIKNS